jgi:hypothetical protein
MPKEQGALEIDNQESTFAEFNRDLHLLGRDFVEYKGWRAGGRQDEDEGKASSPVARLAAKCQ